jgi:hypothetical protein
MEGVAMGCAPRDYIAIGVIFFMLYPNPWLDAPNFAALLVDTETLRKTRNWKGDPWDVNTDTPPGVLTLEVTEEGLQNRSRKIAYRSLEESAV